MKYLLLLGLALAAFHISHATPDFCKLPKADGTGTEFEFSLYYDPAIDRCKPFYYYGVGGNANRFVNERECMRNCSDNIDKYYPMEETAVCHLPKAAGECQNNLVRFYYDSVYKKCKKFFWTGCYGNGNRFVDSLICNQTCAGIHDDGDHPEEDEPDTPIGIICGVLIAVIIVALIITVTVLTIQSKKKSKGKKGKRKDQNVETALREPSIEMA
ncbi:inter-alpha-trypsin inhibitor [Synchiropus picturatus]